MCFPFPLRSSQRLLWNPLENSSMAETEPQGRMAQEPHREDTQLHPACPNKASPAGLADVEAIPTTPARRTGQKSENTLRCQTERFSPWPDITEGLHFTARQEGTFLGPIKKVRETPTHRLLSEGGCVTSLPKLASGPPSATQTHPD